MNENQVQAKAVLPSYQCIYTEIVPTQIEKENGSYNEVR